MLNSTFVLFTDNFVTLVIMPSNTCKVAMNIPI